MNHLTDDASSASPQRLLQLQDFQLRALTHALSFPHVKRVVYSTCSVHAEENEIVVVKALVKSREAGWGFRLKDALPKEVWKTRGGSSEVGKTMPVLTDHGGAEEVNRGDAELNAETSFHLDRCLRASPSTDFTNGFFVALFERDSGSLSKKHEDDAEESDNLEDEDDEAINAKARKRRKKKEAKKRKKLKLVS